MCKSKRPIKRLGQNFLVNTHIQERIVRALEIDSRDHVLEIGPGQGALSGHIIKAGPARYMAIEIDPRWVDLLKKKFRERMELIEGDFLEQDFKDWIDGQAGGLKIIGNIPYNITSPILFRLIDNHSLCKRAVLMTQKEVARRIVSDRGSKEYGILSVLSQAYAQAGYLFEVRRGNFFPVPEVDSAVIRLDFHQTLPGISDERLFRRVVRGTFNYRRKMLRTSLCRIFDKSTVYSIDVIDLNRRPEDLTVNEFVSLSNQLAERLG